MRKFIKGAVAVEFGILLIPMVVLAFGIAEYGRAIYTYNTLAKSVRDAARYLTSQAPGDPTEHDKAKCMVVFGSYDCGEPDEALAPGLSVSMVQTCDRILKLKCDGVDTTLNTGSGTINLVVVRINGYAYDSVIEFVMQDMKFGAISTSMRGQL